MVRHPIHDLRLQDGKLVREISQNYVQPYLNTPPIEIVEKKAATEVSSSNEVAYFFGLSHIPDDTWTELFRVHCEDIVAEISSSILKIQCIPANLEGRYNKIKSAVAKTNTAYDAHRAELMPKVAEIERRRLQEATARESREQTIQTQFDNLPL